MFFRCNLPKETAFSERVDRLRSAGFMLDTLLDGRVKASKHGVTVIIGDEGANQPDIERARMGVGNEVATLLKRWLSSAF